MLIAAFAASLSMLMATAEPEAAASSAIERFFIGTTEGSGTVDVIMSGRHTVRDRSHGRKDASGALILDQTVEEIFLREAAHFDRIFDRFLFFIRGVPPPKLISILRDGEHRVAQALPVVVPVPERGEEGRLEAPDGMAWRQEIVADLLRRDDRAGCAGQLHAAGCM